MYSIGYVLKPQGVKGEIKVEPTSGNPERFKKLKTIKINNTQQKAYSIEHMRLSDRFVYLKLKDVNSRDAAEELRGKELVVEKNELMQLNPGEYFIHDLLGCEVETEEGRHLGKLADILQNSSNDIYIVRDGEGHEVLLPATSDVIKQVDLEGKKIIVHLIDGLID